MTMLRVGHTAEIGERALTGSRELLYAVFDDMTEDDWEHALGGVHAVLWEGDEVIGHASVVQRRLMHGGRTFRTGYVEGVGVRADRRGLGHGAMLMEAVEEVIARAFELGALGATDDGLGFYTSRGWQSWRGVTSALTPTGVVRTPDEDGFILVLPVAGGLDLDGEITCDWRGGDVW
ncbi:MAG: GNAT family N-acetyltransferase [Candidatus Dormibacteraeota bacterium]|nr:GNAT family N-acetyltransferase [Candidatus Dormibacteraeota bacterium]